MLVFLLGAGLGFACGAVWYRHMLSRDPQALEDWAQKIRQKTDELIR